jgi:HK97 family phage major capsid protein
MANSHANDAMIRRLEKELEERNSAAQGLIGNAQDAERDLNESERQTLASLRDRMTEIRSQLGELESTAELANQVHGRMKQLDAALTTARHIGSAEVEYRSAGEWVCDAWQAQLGNREARERIEVFERAAAHQKTSDNPGIVPTPVAGGVINFIDAARPIVSALGPVDLPGQNFYVPLVTQRPSVGLQGSAGAAADEKSELVSQKMLISRLAATAVTYGGYVNVSRQDIDFSSPQIMDIVIQGLADQYAIQTETAAATMLDSTSSTAVGYGASPTAATLTSAVWNAAATVYSAVKNQGRLVLAVAPDRLATFGPLFPPFNVQNGQSAGLLAGNFGQGPVGNLAGIQLVMSAGLASGKAILFSTAAAKVFEQRVGALQATEPSVLGVQVAYAGYFTPLLISNNGIIKLTAT